MQYRFTKLAQKLFKCGDMQHTSLTPDKSWLWIAFSTSSYMGVTTF